MRCFTASEISYCMSKAKPHLHFGGRFAAKEALVKALRLAWESGYSLKNIEIEVDNVGGPVARLTGVVKRAAEELRVTDISVSISHSEHYAVAHAVVLCGSVEETSKQSRSEPVDEPTRRR